MTEPYITPKKLLGDKSLPIKCKLAFICYCPLPSFFTQYDIKLELKDRYFIHIHNLHVTFCQYNNVNFIVVSEVYGGPVSVTTVEELKYYGIDTIIGLGFVGSLKSELPTGTIINGVKALTEEGASRHYTNELYVTPNLDMNVPNTLPECIWTTNALYQEYDEDVQKALSLGCSVVNMDTSHLYASCIKYKILCNYFAVVTDVIEHTTISNNHNNSKIDWKNDLHDIVNGLESHITNSQTLLIQNLCKYLF